MPKKRCLLVLLLVFIIILPVSNVSADIKQTYTMSYTFENRGSSPFIFTRDDVSIPLFLETQHQKVVIKSATPTVGQQYLDSDGNAYVDPGISLEIKQGQKISYTVTYEIESKDDVKPNLDQSKAGLLSNIPAELVSKYTGKTETFQVENEKIVTLARRLAQNKMTVLDKILSIISWFYANITYDSYEVPRSADETLRDLKGDCDDQSILLISMLRSLGIPAYLEIGIVLDSRIDSGETSWSGHRETYEKGVGWHGWAVVYIPPWGWLPVDVVYSKQPTPIDVIKNAPEFKAEFVSCFRVVDQDYVGISRSTREKVINSGLYVKMTDEALVSTKPIWLDPTLLALAATIGGGIVYLFINARKPRKSKETV